MKKFTLDEHFRNASAWWDDSGHFSSERDSDRLFFIAYERWLNDRELLTVEDGYEWKWKPVPEGLLW